MKLSQISFGKEIPIMKCQIKDKKQGEFIPATFYEIDGKDYSDVTNMFNMGQGWYLSPDIAYDMSDQYQDIEIGEKNPPFHFYILKDEQNQPVGICETEKLPNSTDIRYIETKNDCQKRYIGQTMIGMIGKISLENGSGSLSVNTPIKDSLGFYKKCGFISTSKDFKGYTLIIEEPQLEKFIKQTEDKTQAHFIDLTA